MNSPHLRQQEALTRLMDEVRSSFRQLRALAQEVHGGDHLTAPRRSVLLNLLKAGPQTVPALARVRAVSRQHVQNVVNELLADDLVTRIPNPGHKRSKLITLTAPGRATIQQMLEREEALLQALALPHSPTEILRAAAILHDTHVALEELRLSLHDR
jgi:DNA-binding MarR family transcriptional regulator